MRKEVQKNICYVILLGMALCLSACAGVTDVIKEKEVSTESVDSTEQAPKKQVYEYTEADFLILSEAYKEKGELDKQRETLIEMHKWFPSKENAGRISDVVVYKSIEDMDVVTLMDAACVALENEAMEEMKALIASEDWGQQMQDALVGVTRKTKYMCETYVAQVTSDSYTTEMMLVKKDHTFWYYKQNQAGLIWGRTSCIDDTYEGEYELAYWNAEGEKLKTCMGEFKTNLSIGKFTVTYNGTTYTGEVSDTGTTMEEQKKDVTDAGSVIYAYDASKGKYLYEENCTVETFVIDAQYLGLPIYKEW